MFLSTDLPNALKMLLSGYACVKPLRSENFSAWFCEEISEVYKKMEKPADAEKYAERQVKHLTGFAKAMNDVRGLNENLERKAGDDGDIGGPVEFAVDGQTLTHNDPALDVEMQAPEMQSRHEIQAQVTEKTTTDFTAAAHLIVASEPPPQDAATSEMDTQAQA